MKKFIKLKVMNSGRKGEEPTTREMLFSLDAIGFITESKDPKYTQIVTKDDENILAEIPYEQFRNALMGAGLIL